MLIGLFRRFIAVALEWYSGHGNNSKFPIKSLGQDRGSRQKTVGVARSILTHKHLSQMKKKIALKRSVQDFQNVLFPCWLTTSTTLVYSYLECLEEKSQGQEKVKTRWCHNIYPSSSRVPDLVPSKRKKRGDCLEPKYPLSGAVRHFPFWKSINVC